MANQSVALHVNVDHVCTLRQARGHHYPDPVAAALLCESAGADGITVHLREDRRHVQDRDVEVLSKRLAKRLNLEMAPTNEMVDIAIGIRPHLVTLVPEKRQERTTEGGLDLVHGFAPVEAACKKLHAAGLSISLFLDPDVAQLQPALRLPVKVVELHTGDYANAELDVDRALELQRLAAAAQWLTAQSRSERRPALIVAAGHGLTVTNVAALVAAVPQIAELNIGHALVADAVFHGLGAAVAAFRDAIAVGQRSR